MVWVFGYTMTFVVPLKKLYLTPKIHQRNRVENNMKLTSVQKRLLEQDEKQQGAQKAPEKAPKASPEVKEPTGASELSLDVPDLGNGQEGSPDMSPNEIEKVKSVLKAIEKLQKAAADMEAARFTIQQEYSDFTLAKRLDSLKQEVVSIIGKAKEHVSRSTMNSPEAKKEMLSWLGL